MAEYFEREAALALVRPDAPEDEKTVVTIATAKNSFGALCSEHPLPTLFLWCTARTASTAHCRQSLPSGMGSRVR